MLEQGPYPLDLKRRIRGPDGHLSNQQAGNLLRSVFHRGLELVVLAHLSETNNAPEKALDAARGALARSGRDRTRILVSRQHDPVPMMRL
jgi:phosphoribosyl 1,2-cyclic phosphodiesterase